MVSQTYITVVLESEGVRCCVTMAVVSAAVLARSRSRLRGEDDGCGSGSFSR